MDDVWWPRRAIIKNIFFQKIFKKYIFFSKNKKVFFFNGTIRPTNFSLFLRNNIFFLQWHVSSAKMKTIVARETGNGTIRPTDIFLLQGYDEKKYLWDGSCQ